MSGRVGALYGLAAIVLGCAGGGANPATEPAAREPTAGAAGGGEPESSGKPAPEPISSGRLQLDAPALPGARVGQLFEQPIAAPAGAMIVAWSLGAEAPGWLLLNRETDGSATLVGTPEHSGTYPVRVSVETANGEQLEGLWSLQVEPKRWLIYVGSTQPPGTEPPLKSDTALVLALDPSSDVVPVPVELPDGSSNDSRAWSADGNWLAGAAFGGTTVRLWDMGGMQPGAPIVLHPTRAADGGIESIQGAPTGARFAIAAPPFAPSSSCGAAGCSGGVVYTLDPSSADGPRLEQLEGTSSGTISWSPDGASLLVTSSDLDTLVTNLVLIDVEDRSRASRRLISSKGSLEVRWSPDARWISVAASDLSGNPAALYLIDVAAARMGMPVLPWRGHADGPAQPAGNVLAWSPDGAWLFLRIAQPAQPGSYEHQLVDMRGRAPGDPIILQRSTPNTGGLLRADYWSPDSRRLVLATSRYLEDLLVFDVNSAQMGPVWQWHLSAPAGDAFVSWTASSALLFRDGDTLFVQPLDDDGEPARIPVGDDPSSALLLSPDHAKLAYQAYPEERELRMVVFDPLENHSVAFQDTPGLTLYQGVSWLADSSGLAAITRVDELAGEPAPCPRGCRLEYAMLGPDGVPLPSHAVAGRATFDDQLGGVLVQP